MIKLVAIDMDGTLLNDKKEIPIEFEAVVCELKQRGTMVVIASGRQYYTLEEGFPQSIRHKLTYIAENGALICDKGKPIAKSLLSKETIPKIINTLRQIDGAYPILCGVDYAYGEDNEESFNRNATMYYKKYKRLDNILDCIDKDEFCKVAVWDKKGVVNNSYKSLESFNASCQVIMSGSDWVDLMGINASKGNAIKTLQKIYSIKPEESMAFGDHMNDYDMMLACTQSYAMANAFPELKKVCRFTAPSNNDNGVIAVLKSYIDNGNI